MNHARDHSFGREGIPGLMTTNLRELLIRTLDLQSLKSPKVKKHLGLVLISQSKTKKDTKGI